eukprot:m.7037 g.7037  ORF g.7037 m.7037 type:complete len:1470 (+) comp2797_c0_seq1:203-4612(+)
MSRLLGRRTTSKASSVVGPVSGRSETELYALRGTGVVGTEFTEISKDAAFVSRQEAVVQAHFTQHTCNTYIPKRGKKQCECNRQHEGHGGQELPEGTPWQMSKHTSREPSQSFGTLKFVNHLPATSAPFLRCSVHDSPLEAINFVRACLRRKSQRKYRTPSLIISITGGARHFSLPQRLLTSIRKGLIMAADSTDAWIITGGTQSGVMKLIGDIMSDTAFERPVPVIGIATWGVLGNRDEMSKPALHERLDIKYSAPKSGVPLDPNHNMFLLVDNGTVDKFGVEIPFRAAFEREASRIAAREDSEGTDSSELNIPVVTIIIQGGPGSLKTAHDAVVEGTPLVVVEGTGQAADMLAYAWYFLHGASREYQSYSVRELRRLIERAWTKDPAKVEDYLVQIFECVDDAEKVVISSFSSSAGDLDVAILQAVFSGSHSALRANLRQAMRWNRLDIARQALVKAFRTPDGEKKHADALNDNLMWALKHNNPSFVELFLEFGAQSYLLRPTVLSKASEKASDDFQRALIELYRSAAKDRSSHVAGMLAHCSRKTEGGDIELLQSIHGFLAHRVSRKFQFKPDFFKLNDPTVLLREKNSIASHALMFWAVCLDKFRLAHMFWHRGDQSMPNALVASRLLDQLSKHDVLNRTHLVDEREKMIYNSKKFENLAVGVLEQCHNSDSRKSGLMLHRGIPQYRDQNCIQVAHQANNLQFVSHPAAQAVIDKLWMGSMDQKTRWWQIALSVLCFPLVLFIITFRRSIDEYGTRELDGPTDDEEEDDDQHYDADGKGSEVVDLTAAQRYARFYSAPFTRFWIDFLAFFALLLLHSYVLLDEYGDSLSVLEFVLLIWFSSMFLEEFRQGIVNGARDHFSDVWNDLDATIILLYFCGFAARITNTEGTENLVYSKTFGAINTLFLWLRLARYYAVSETLGPKLLMMQRMAGDVSTFLGLLAVFLISFGIATQALLFPDRPFDFNSFVGIFYRPYFQMYGELMLEDVAEDSDCIGTYPFSSCGWTSSWIAPILLAAYLLFTNILLINLLIAMFNQTYVEVQDSARQLWNMQNYELYKEYKDKPILPLPLIVFNHMVLCIRWCCCRKPDEEHYEEPGLDRMLYVFQETNTDKFIAKWRHAQEKEVDAQLEKVTKGLKTLSQSLADLQDQNATLRQMVERSSSEATGGALGVTSISMVLGSTPGSPVKTLQRDASYLPPPEYPYHDAMTEDPPRRGVVMQHQVSWSVPFPDYAPVDYTAPFVLTAEWADPAEYAFINFNEAGRETYFPPLKLNDLNCPINPFGRTGMTGRGTLGKWGVNHAVDPIVTRWKRNAQGDIVYRDNKKVLEFVAIRRRQGLHEWAIPGGFVEKGQTLSQTLKREFMEEAMREEGMSEEERRHAGEMVDELFENGELVKNAYCRDPRNTDNAWIETQAWHFHDDSGLGVGKFRLQAGDDAINVKWRMVHRYQTLFASHVDFISLVAHKMDAFW